MLGQSLITSGKGKAIACAIGKQSRVGNNIASDLKELETQTPMQERLEVLGTYLLNFGIYASLIILVAAVVNLILTLIFAD